MMMETLLRTEDEGHPLGRRQRRDVFNVNGRSKETGVRSGSRPRSRVVDGARSDDDAAAATFVTAGRSNKNDDNVDDDDDEAMAEVDALQALNTALCFLVSINADAQCVEDFLLAHPGALLLEGTGHLPEESATHILNAQSRSCQCFSPLCQSNRVAVQKLLDRGFEHYSARRLLPDDDPMMAQPTTYHPIPTGTRSDTGAPRMDWGRTPSLTMSGWESTAYGQRMRALERTVRVARRTELRLRHDVLDAAMRVRELDAEHRRFIQRRENTGSYESHKGSVDDSGRPTSTTQLTKSIWTLCSQRPPSQLHDASAESSDHMAFRARISEFEYELRMAQLRLSSLEREHAEQLRQIRSARRFQFGILKRSFEDCRRHVCLNAIANAAASATTSA